MGILHVTTASGRLYEIDMDARKYKRSGDAPSIDYRSGGPLQMETWLDFTLIDVNDMGRMIFIETDGTYSVSTRVVEGLDELLAALDG